MPPPRPSLPPLALPRLRPGFERCGCGARPARAGAWRPRLMRSPALRSPDPSHHAPATRIIIQTARTAAWAVRIKVRLRPDTVPAHVAWVRGPAGAGPEPPPLPASRGARAAGGGEGERKARLWRDLEGSGGRGGERWRGSGWGLDAWPACRPPSRLARGDGAAPAGGLMRWARAGGMNHPAARRLAKGSGGVVQRPIAARTRAVSFTAVPA